MKTNQRLPGPALRDRPPQKNDTNSKVKDPRLKSKSRRPLQIQDHNQLQMAGETPALLDAIASLRELMDCGCENFGVVLDVRFGCSWGHQRHIVERG
jgi:ribosome assembly protein YihI (activator of Der GTPase)